MASGEEQMKAKKKPAETKAASTDAPAKTEKSSTEDIDKLLDEIDEVLEENAEEFVRGFVQKGGQ